MSGAPLVVITTRLPPLTCGVGAHSWMTHTHWPNVSSSTLFLVMEGAAESRARLGWDSIAEFNGDPDKLVQALTRAGPANILLHYAARAYQRLGCPVWMPGVLEKWKASFTEGRLTIFFHEVPGRLPRLSRHFLLGKINARIIRRLAGSADALVTNTENHAAILRKIARRDEVHCIPVGSNIPGTSSGEPRAETEFVIFGLPFGRGQTLQAFAAEIRKWRAAGLLTKLHLIGPDQEQSAVETDRVLAEFSDVAVRHGWLEEAKISEWLGHVRFALTNADRETWSKSGAFMACAAHGCAVVIKRAEGGVPLSFAIAAEEVGKISPAEIEQRAGSLQKWYEANADWRVTTRRLVELCQPEERPV